MSRVLTIALTSIALVTITTASAEARGGRSGGRLFGSSKTVAVPAAGHAGTPSSTRSVLVPGIRPAARDDGRTAAANQTGSTTSSASGPGGTGSAAPRPVKASVEPCAASKLFGSGAGFCQIN